MAEIEFCEEIIPFVCGNPKCQKEYDQNQFAEVILLWGYIYLISEEHQVGLVGMTCPQCRKTTVLKYRAYTAMTFWREMWRNLPQDENVRLTERWRGQYFSAQHLVDSGLLVSPVSSIKADNKIVYTFPQEIVFDSYSDSLQEANAFWLVEEDLSAILTIENQQSYKAVPRVIPHKGLYNAVLDSMLLDKRHENINSSFNEVLRANASLRINPFEGLNTDEYDVLLKEFGHPCPAWELPPTFEMYGLKWEKKKLSDQEKDVLLSQNDLTIEEYSHFLISALSWKRKAFQDNVDDFLSDLDKVRNQIDCELVYRNQLVNKYGRIFYYKTRIIEEERLYLDELGEIEDMCSLEQESVNVQIPRPPVKDIHGGQLMEKWDMDAYGILNLIQNYGLGGFDSITSTYLLPVSFDTNFVSTVMSGDIEHQKQVMSRFRFDPNLLEMFKKDNAHLFNPAEVLSHNEGKKKRKRSKRHLLQDKHKEAMIEVAKEIWAKEPDVTITAMAIRDEITNVYSKDTGGELYAESTIRKAIRDYKPNKRSGRPRKKS